MELCKQVALYKQANGMQIFQTSREKEILEKLIAAGRAPWMKWDG